MITCPTCGSAVASTQRYCGNCGTDIQAALAAHGAPIADAQPPPYAYTQPAYDYPPAGEPSRTPIRLILIIGIALLVMCCACACGLIIGFELIPDLLGLMGIPATPSPTPRFTPTPTRLPPTLQSMLLWFI